MHGTVECSGAGRQNHNRGSKWACLISDSSFLWICNANISSFYLIYYKFYVFYFFSRWKVVFRDFPFEIEFSVSKCQFRVFRPFSAIAENQWPYSNQIQAHLKTKKHVSVISTSEKSHNITTLFKQKADLSVIRAETLMTNYFIDHNIPIDRF